MRARRAKRVETAGGAVSPLPPPPLAEYGAEPRKIWLFCASRYPKMAITGTKLLEFFPLNQRIEVIILDVVIIL